MGGVRTDLLSFMCLRTSGRCFLDTGWGLVVGGFVPIPPYNLKIYGGDWIRQAIETNVSTHGLALPFKRPKPINGNNRLAAVA